MNKRINFEELEDMEGWGTANLARIRWPRDAQIQRRPRGWRQGRNRDEEKQQRRH